MLRRMLAVFCLTIAVVTTVVAQNSFAYQAVIRNAKGELVTNQEISMRFSLVYDGNVVYSETHKTTTNQYGNVQVNVGEGTRTSESGKFADVPWSSMKVMMKIEADPKGGSNYIDLGTIQLQPAPYAMYAPAAGAVNAIQAGEPKSDGDALFEVKDKNGNVVFAVYRDGVRVFVDDADSTKAMATGFAVAGRRAAKEGEEADIFSVTAEGTQVFVSEEDTAGGKPMATGFAVAGRRAAKDMNADLFSVNSTGTQIYINNDVEAGKPMATGFAVAGRRAAKDDTTGSNQNDKYLEINADGTRVYIDDDSADNSDKPIRTGFAVAGRRAAKGDSGSSRKGSKYMEINADGTQIYVDDEGGKPMATGFAVAGRRAAKGENIKLFEVNSYGTQIYIETSGKAMRTGFAVAGRKAAKDGVTNKYLVIDADGTCIYVDYEEAKAMQTGFAVAGRRAAKDGTPNTILSVDNVDGTRAYVDDVEGKAMATGFAVAGRRAAKEGEKFMSINKDTVKITTTQLEVQSTEIDEAVLIMNGGSTKITTDLFVLAEKEGDEPLLSADNSGVDVSTNVVVRGDVTQAVESEALDLAKPILMTAINKIDTLDCASAVTELGEVKGYRLLKIYGNGLFALPQTPDADGNSFILFDADGNIASTIEDAFAAVVMTNPGTTDAKVLVWPLKQRNSLNISFGVTTADSTKQYVRVDAIINASAGIESKVEALAAEVNTGSVEVEGRTVYGNIITLTANNNKGYHFVQWSDGSDVNPRTLRYAGTTAFTAMFDINTYNISVKATDGGAVDGSGIYNHGEDVTITATADEHYHFVNWNGDFQLDKAELTFAAKNDTAFTAIFELNSHSVKYMVDNEVIKDTTIVFGQPVPQPKTNIEKEGHNLVWEIDEEMTMPDEPITVLGRWEAIEYTITFVDESGATLYEKELKYGEKPVYEGDEPAKAQTAQYKYSFIGWKPEINENTTVTDHTTYKAQFEEILREYEITVKASPELGGTVSGGGTYPYSEEANVTLTATAKSGYVFVKWSDDETAPATRKVAVTGEATYTAVFEQHLITVMAYPSMCQTVTGVIEKKDGETQNVTFTDDGEGDYGMTIDGSVVMIHKYTSYVSHGSKLTISATGKENYEVTGWKIDGEPKTDINLVIENVTENKIIELNFGLATKQITIGVSKNAGTVKAQYVLSEGELSDIILTDGESSEDMNYFIAKCEIGSTVRLTATENTGYDFKGWKIGELVSNNNPFDIEVSDDISIETEFAASVIYVSSDGKASNSGLSANEPLPSIAEALKRIPFDDNQENWMDWEIRIMGTLEGSQSLESEPIENDEGDIVGYEPIAAKSITIIGNTGLDEYNQPQDVIDGGWRRTIDDSGYETWVNENQSANPSPALTIRNVSAPVIIKNLAIIGGYVYETGGGMYVESSSKYATKVIIDDGTVVRGNKALYGGGVYVYSNSYYDGTELKKGVAEVTMNGGIIGGNSDEDANYADINTNTGIGGGGVLVCGDSAKFSMKSGSIKNNLAAGGGAGVCVYDGALFEMEAGTIEANKTTEDSWNGYGGGVLIKYDSKFIMTGGSISNNQAFREGGGVHVSGGTLEMSGESVISGNHASTGGGVYLNSSSTLTMTGGNIIGNVADEGSGVYLESADRINMSDTAVIDANNDVCLYCVWDKNATINVGKFNFANENAYEKTKVATITPGGYSQEEDFYLIGDNSEFGRFDVSPIINEQGNIEFYTITSEGKLQKKEDAALIAVYYDYNETSQRSELKTYMNLKPSDEGYIDIEELENYDYEPPKTPDGSSIEYEFDGWYVNYGDGYERFNFDQQITTTTVIYGMFSANIDAEEDDKLSDMVKFMDDPLTNYYINFRSSMHGPQVIEQPVGHQLPNSITLRGDYEEDFGLHGGWGSEDNSWEYWSGYYSSDDFDSSDDFEQFIKQPVLTIRTKAPINIEYLEISGGYSTGILVEAEGGSLTLGQGTQVTGNGYYYNDGNPSYYDEDDQLCCIGVDIHPKCELYMEGNAYVADDNVIVLKTDLSLYSDDYPKINIDGLDDEDDIVAVIDPTSFSSWTVLTGDPENISKQCGRFKVVPYNGNQYGVAADGNIAQLISVTFKDGNEVLTDLTQYVASGSYATEPKAPIKIGYTLTGWYNAVTKRMFDFSETQITESLELVAVWESWMVEEDGHYFVDLGTGDNTLWATTNVGAENVWDFGDYYAWGETEPRYTIGGDGVLTWKSTYNGYDGTKSSTFVKQDVATIAWGGSSSMPTKEQIQSLVSSGYWVWTDSYNGKGKSGFIVYKLKDGDTHQVFYRGSEPYDSYSLADVHIFLPAAGYYVNKNLYDGSEQFTNYWSQTEYDWSENGDQAYTLLMFGSQRSSSGVKCDYSTFKWRSGNPVRAVTQAKYTITFVSQGGSNIEPMKFECGSTPSSANEPQPVNEGKKFAGWYTDASCTYANKFVFGETPLTDNITLYAKWVETWMIDGGDGHYYVDLGIGTYWATTNVGASDPERAGDYIAWSENLGDTWGDGWAAPTKAQFAQLASCQKEYTGNYAGTNKAGAIVYATSNTDKSLDKAHIFIPFVGLYSGSYYENTDYGYYWTSEVAEDDKANYIQFSKSSTGSVSVMGDGSSETSMMGITKGLSVRLVRKENGTSQIAPEGFVLVEGATVTGPVYAHDYVAGGTEANLAMTKSYVFVDGRTVEINDFYMSDHTVTQAEFNSVMSGSVTGSDNLPANQISWYAAIAYCNKLSLRDELDPVYSVKVNGEEVNWQTLQQSQIPTTDNADWNAVTADFTKNGYRLPTEAEWEYAALGGHGLSNVVVNSDGTYGEQQVDEVAWYNTTSTHEVKQKLPNPLGLYDMCGNVWEMVGDWWIETITSETPAAGPASGEVSPENTTDGLYHRVHRGAGYMNKINEGADGTYNNIMSRTKHHWAPAGKPDGLGFRVVRTVKKENGTSSTYSGSENGHDWVDLGLTSGNKWATTNVGATEIDGYGDYLAWGETETHYVDLSAYPSVTWKSGKQGYTWSNYTLGTENNITKYNSGDAITTLEAIDDAAQTNVNWGGRWVTPSVADFVELYNECYWEWKVGINDPQKAGYIVYKSYDKSKDHGLTKESGHTYSIATDPYIFFPEAGWYSDAIRGYYGYTGDGGAGGCYWTNQVYSGNTNKAYSVGLSEGAININSNTSNQSTTDRYIGFQVRPVIPGDFVTVNQGETNLLVTKTLITQAEYEKFMAYHGDVVGGSTYKPTETSAEDKEVTPAYYTSFVDAVIYCNLRSLAEGLKPVYSMKYAYEKPVDDDWKYRVTDTVSYWTIDEDLGVVAVDGKYCFAWDKTKDIDYYNNWDLDCAYLQIDNNANGYRLPTKDEIKDIWTWNASNGNVVKSHTDTDGNVDMFEWTNNLDNNGHANVFSGDITDINIYDDFGNWYCNYSHVYLGTNFTYNLGFRIVRNVQTQP